MINIAIEILIIVSQILQKESILRVQLKKLIQTPKMLVINI